MPRSVVIPVLLAALCAAACQEQPCENDLSCQGKDQVCNPTTRQCEERGPTSPPACSTETECRDGRACVNGKCRFAPACLNLTGNWLAGKPQPDDTIMEVGTVPVTQTMCHILIDVETGTRVEAVVDRTGTLTDATVQRAGVTTPCTAQWSGDDTMRFSCTSAMVSYQFFARPSSADGLAPVPCTSSCGACASNAIGVRLCQQ